MQLIEAHNIINNIGVPVFSTNDIATTLNITTSHASNILNRLVVAGFLAHLSRGLWGIINIIDPLKLPEYLSAPLPSYISLQSALYFHGLISQVPEVIYAVSLARTKVITTTLGCISLHHLQPAFFFGFTIEGKEAIKIATPEKALIDFLYLTPAKNDLFQALPELELPSDFNTHLLWEIVEKIPAIRRRNMVKTLLNDIV